MSAKIELICDRCKKPIKSLLGSNEITLSTSFNYKRYDFCPSCTKKLDRVIREFVKESGDDE